MKLFFARTCGPIETFSDMKTVKFDKDLYQMQSNFLWVSDDLIIWQSMRWKYTLHFFPFIYVANLLVKRGCRSNILIKIQFEQVDKLI